MEHGVTTGGELLPPLPPAGTPGAPAALTRPVDVTAGRRRRLTRGRFGAGWPLAAVLVVQTVLSLRLVRADTAFQDEALYLWAGHQQWAHWLHGRPLPPFAAYFSGAPVLYPPLGALADSLGGLAGARILSLVFMLGATVLLWDTARRLGGKRTAFFAAALFAVLGPTLHVGSFATYDALSVVLIALATWLVIRAAGRPEVTASMVAAGVVLALANACAYSSALFDPVVVALAFLAAWPRHGARAAASRIVTLLTVTVVLIGAAWLIGGSQYSHGVTVTTLGRVHGTTSARSVLADAWTWTGLVVIAAACGSAIAWARHRGAALTWLLAVLTVTALLGPLEQASLHTMASLNKHVDLGAWFAAIAAGYAVDQVIGAVTDERSRAVTAVACVVALAFPASLGISQSWRFATFWPSSASFTDIFGPLTGQGSGRLLVEDPSIAEYYLPAGADWQRWSSTRNIVLPGGHSTGGPSQSAGVVGPGNAGTYAQYIAQGYFSYVALNYADTTDLDLQIQADLERNPRYHRISVVPYGQGTYVIFKYEPAT
jgi:hypothetical protein